MQDLDLIGFQKYLAENGFEMNAIALVAIGIFLFLVVVYLVRKYLLDNQAETPNIADAPPPRRTEAAKPVPAPKAEPKPVVAAKPGTPAVRAAATVYSHIPQDSVLRRHYLAHIKYMLVSLKSPRPTDSVLRRHYEQLIHSEFQACLRDPARMEMLKSDYESRRAARAALAQTSPEPLAAAAQAPTPVSAPPATQAVDTARPSARIPQDSVLRRHFMTQVLYMLKTVRFPQPTDSVLRRHYEQLILSEFVACLRDQARMEKLLAEYERRRASRAAVAFD